MKRASFREFITKHCIISVPLYNTGVLRAKNEAMFYLGLLVVIIVAGLKKTRPCYEVSSSCNFWLDHSFSASPMCFVSPSPGEVDQ